MIDVHCHLNFHKFDEDYDKVIQNAVSSGVTTIVNVGTTIVSSKKAVELANKYQNLYAIVGIHPHHADKPEERWLEELESLAKHKKVIGIGEIGMDYFSYKSNGIVDLKIQEDVFRKQIELSIKLSLPIQIHNRQSGEDVIRILSDYKSEFQSLPGMFHCFSASKNVLRDALDMGFYIGFDGNITYDGIAKGESVKLSDLLALTPLERLFIETDSPYLTPAPFRGSRNEPKHAIIIGEYIAKIKEISYNTLEQQIDRNFEAVFDGKL